MATTHHSVTTTNLDGSFLIECFEVVDGVRSKAHSETVAVGGDPEGVVIRWQASKQKKVRASERKQRQAKLKSRAKRKAGKL